MEAFFMLVVLFWVSTALGRLLAHLGQTAVHTYTTKRATPPTAQAPAAEVLTARHQASAVQPGRCLAQGIVHARGTARRTLNGKTFEQAYLDVGLKSGEVKRIWGEDLPRALDAAGARQGERVRVIFQGMQDVQVEEDGTIQIKQKRVFEIKRLA